MIEINIEDARNPMVITRNDAQVGTFEPITGMHICVGREGNYVLRTQYEILEGEYEDLNKELQLAQIDAEHYKALAEEWRDIASKLGNMEFKAYQPKEISDAIDTARRMYHEGCISTQSVLNES